MRVTVLPNANSRSWFLLPSKFCIINTEVQLSGSCNVTSIHRTLCIYAEKSDQQLIIQLLVFDLFIITWDITFMQHR
jgi:hypothetical protein